jgi:hypothetical protein
LSVENKILTINKQAKCQSLKVKAFDSFRNITKLVFNKWWYYGNVINEHGKKKRETRTQNKHEENLHQQKKIPQSIPQITNAIHPNGAFPCKD